MAIDALVIAAEEKRLDGDKGWSEDGRVRVEVDDLFAVNEKVDYPILVHVRVDRLFHTRDRLDIGKIVFDVSELRHKVSRLVQDLFA